MPISVEHVLLNEYDRVTDVLAHLVHAVFPSVRPTSGNSLLNQSAGKCGTNHLSLYTSEQSFRATNLSFDFGDVTGTRRSSLNAAKDVSTLQQCP